MPRNLTEEIQWLAPFALEMNPRLRSLFKLIVEIYFFLSMPEVVKLIKYRYSLLGDLGHVNIT